VFFEATNPTVFLLFRLETSTFKIANSTKAEAFLESASILLAILLFEASNRLKWVCGVSGVLKVV